MKVQNENMQITNQLTERLKLTRNQTRNQLETHRVSKKVKMTSIFIRDNAGGSCSNPRKFRRHAGVHNVCAGWPGRMDLQ